MPSGLACTREVFEGQDLSDTLNWLESVISNIQLVSTIESSIARVTDLVVAVKKYAYEGKVGSSLNVHESLHSTLIILGHKLRHKAIVLRKHFASELPPLEIEICQPFELAVFVDHLQSDRTSQRAVMPDAAKDLDQIGFNPLSSTATVASLPTARLDIDRIGFDRHACGKTVHEGQHRLAVRFASSPVTQHLCTTWDRDRFQIASFGLPI